MPKINKYKKKECPKHGKVKFVLEGRGYYRCTKCRSENVSKSRKNTKAKLVSHFGGKCIKCGYDKCVEALQFHHIDPNKKEFGLSVRGLTRSYKALLKEAKKCDLVCANCHAEIHSNDNSEPSLN